MRFGLVDLLVGGNPFASSNHFAFIFLLNIELAIQALATAMDFQPPSFSRGIISPPAKSGIFILYLKFNISILLIFVFADHVFIAILWYGIYIYSCLFTHIYIDL